MKEKILKNQSIKVKMTMVLIVIMASTILLSICINILMIEPYYVFKEKKNITQVYDSINHLLNTKGADNNSYKISKIVREYNYRMLIVNNENGQVVYSSEGKQGLMYNDMISTLEDMRKIKRQISEKGYAVVSGSDKESTGTSINLLGYFDNGYAVVINTPMESIQTSAVLSGRFTAYVGALLSVAGGIAMYIYSKQFTKPIEEMAAAANRMSNLDFDVKVIDCGEDELGHLGESLNELSSKLEYTISELKTANNELRQDIEQKVQIDEMRTEFLSHVSHELKTPIALIQGYAEGLKDNVSADEESREFYCDVIADEAKKMNRMVQKLLTLNQIEFGNHQVSMERFNIQELIQNMLSANTIFFQKENITVEFHEPPTYVWADEFMIEEVFGNYLSNARNHVLKNGRIAISFQRIENDLRVTVFNSGSHIPEEDLDKLWVKFYKVDKARTREYGGSGIGLSIVAATMKAHGKQYGVNNVEGGVEFYFDVDCANA